MVYVFSSWLRRILAGILFIAVVAISEDADINAILGDDRVADFFRDWYKLEPLTFSECDKLKEWAGGGGTMWTTSCTVSGISSLPLGDNFRIRTSPSSFPPELHDSLQRMLARDETKMPTSFVPMFVEVKGGFVFLEPTGCEIQFYSTETKTFRRIARARPRFVTESISMSDGKVLVSRTMGAGSFPTPPPGEILVISHDPQRTIVEKSISLPFPALAASFQKDGHIAVLSSSFIATVNRDDEFKIVYGAVNALPVGLDGLNVGSWILLNGNSILQVGDEYLIGMDIGIVRVFQIMPTYLSGGFAETWYVPRRFGEPLLRLKKITPPGF